VVHAIHTSVKGRSRFKVEELYRSEALKERLELDLSSRERIQTFSANILTGNVLVFFNSDNTPQTIALLIEGIVLYHKKQNGNKIPTGYPLTNSGSARNKKASSISRRKIRKSVIHSEDQRVESWHLMEATDVLKIFETSKRYGLTPASAKENLKRYGPNILPESVPRSGLSIFIDQFKSLPVALLGVAAGISVVTGGLADALVIIGVVAINATIGYVTESQAEKTIHSLKSLVKPISLVVRGGNLKEIGAEEVVSGEILVLRPGSYVPADARLIEANRLTVDESALTGESMPVLKRVESLELRVMSKDSDSQILNTELQTPNPGLRTDIPLADRINMVYMGTLVTGGQGIAVVVATGRFTEIGKIQTLVGEAKHPETPMERQLNRMGTQLVIIGGAVCGVVFMIGLLRGYGFLQMLKTSISLAVAAVPEGLPTVATTTLALGIRNMRRHNVHIRHLDAVETLGSVQTICLDKTGTITLNRMSVIAIYTGMQRFKVSHGKFLLENKNVNPYYCDELLRLLHISVLCNESEVIGQKGEYVVNGSPTENALIHVALSSGVDILTLREKFPLLSIIHRSENRNYMYTRRRAQNNSTIIAVKGSPNEVLSLCIWYMKEGEKLPLTDDDRFAIEIENERMAGDALRVLGVAYVFIDKLEVKSSEFRVDSSENILNSELLTLNSELIWLGLVGMADPIRDGVKELMDEFHKAGIDTVMITGDQSPTAYAIGKELNLSKGDQLEILDSTHIANIEPDVMKALCERVHVFARVSPAHKLQIVQALQSAGKVVAMTGDGINDGPALKAADIGVAMGHTGTDVAREVADVVLEDDNLETMVIAVSQGRTIYNNIRKSVHFLLSTNLSEIMVMFTAIAGGLGQPLSAMQLLWINLMSDIAPGLALALEPPEPDVLSRPPRNPGEPIIKTSDFKRITFESAALSAGALGAYGYGIARYGMGQRAGTMAFMSLTMGQLLHAISCRSEQHSIFDNVGANGRSSLPPNKYLNIALGGSFVLQILSMAVPGLRGLLGITPINLLDGIVIGGSAVLPLLVNEGTKQKLLE
jgi:Ca2+-transporting ATPase